MEIILHNCSTCFMKWVFFFQIIPILLPSIFLHGAEELKKDHRKQTTDGEKMDNFGFGFNDVNYSDRTLLIELIPNSKGIEATESSENPSASGSQMKTIHINTLILATKSPFFFKLFSNGMAESKQRVVTLQIQESEEAAFMDMLKFMYTNSLSRTTSSSLLDVLVAADKYEVASCMKYCFELLHKLPMTCELALVYLDSPSTILMDDTILQLTSAAKEFLVARFKDISKFWEEMLNLPLAGIEAVLSSDDLRVSSEDEIYNFVMMWARRHYTKPSERGEILITHLLHLIRFSFMSRSKLEEVLTYTDISLEHRTKLVFDAITLETRYRQLPPVKEHERAYKLRPVKVVRFESPREEFVVYFDLKHEECAQLLPSGQIRSQAFDLGGQVSYLVAMRHVNKDSSVESFGLFFGMQENRSGLVFVYEFAARTEPREEFVCRHKLEYEFTKTKGEAYGCPDLLKETWATFIAEDSPYFINGVLHLRVVIQTKKKMGSP